MLAVQKHVAASTQNQALSALLFLYKRVLELNLELIDDVVRAKRPKYLPVVLTKPEVINLLNAMTGVNALIAKLLYGTGMRLMEALRLCVQDVDFEQHQIIIRSGKDNKDRVTTLPESLVNQLKGQMEKARVVHQNNIAEGYGRAYLPFALDREYSGAGLEFGWQYCFPSMNRSTNPLTGQIGRHHLHEKILVELLRSQHDKLVYLNELVIHGHPQKYLELVDWCGRIIREDIKGAMDNNLPHILQRLNIEASHFIYLSKHFEQPLTHLAGTACHVKQACEEIGQHWVHGIRHCETFFSGR